MRVRMLTVGLIAALAAAGCGGSKGAPVEGNVVVGGRAYNPATDGDLMVKLTGSDASKGYNAKVEPDGTFKIVATDGSGGVPPGKYKVGYTRYPMKEEMAKAKGPPMPTTKETGEEWDVGGGKKFTLDMSKAK